MIPATSSKSKRASIPSSYFDQTPASEELPAPPLHHRFLLGKADDLNDISGAPTPPAQITAWRAFNEEEDERLQEAWFAMNLEIRQQALDKAASRSKEGKDKGKAKETNSKDEATHLDELFKPDESPPDHVQVGVDALFTVDLKDLTCYPVFWVGGRIPVQVGSWFYPCPAPNKYLPVESVLADKLEAAYHRIKPWIPGYEDELKAAVVLGAEAEQKLRIELEDSPIDAIFQGPESARLYSRGVASRLSKSILTTFLSGSGQHAGGSLVLRGFDAVMRHAATKTTSAKSSRSHSPTPSTSESARRKSDASPPNSRPSSPSPAVHKQGTAAAKLASILRTKASTSSLKGTAASTAIEEVHNRDQAESSTDTASAQVMEEHVPEDSDASGEKKPVELRNLVLVIHGIGQKLADIYESFSFNYAVNQLRSNANKHCTDPAFAELLDGQRAQFLPIRWRANLNLEGGSIDRTGDQDAENLDNKFTIGDIEPEGLPFIRSLVSNVLIDLPFYLSHHRGKMTQALVLEANRVYRLFCLRNPDFEANGGKVSLIAHSLGALLATDILSEQPCTVSPLTDQPLSSLQSTTTFCFNTRCCFFVGSPAAFFFYLNGAQLIARAGRERTRSLPPDVALDRTRWGCLSVDDLYNVYYTNDPVAYAMNPVVDVKHAKRIQPLAIPSQTSSLLEGIGSSFARVSALWQGMSMPSFGSSATPAPTEAEKPKLEGEKSGTDTPPVRPFPFRSTTYEELGPYKAAEIRRAQERFKALNPQGNLDFYLPDDSSYISIPYYGAIMSHANYWTDLRFSAFIVTQILSSPQALEASKRKLEGGPDLTVD